MNCSKPGPGRQRAFAKLALLVMHGNIFVGLLSTELFFSDLGQEVPFSSVGLSLLVYKMEMKVSASQSSWDKMRQHL